MKKILIGLISIVMLGQVCSAQPVSDKAVIPVGITIQSIMRLTITNGGNIEFVFDNANDLNVGIASGTGYQTLGTVSTSQDWDLTLSVDAATFQNEDATATIPLATVAFTTTCALGTTANGDLSDGWAAGPANYVIVDAAPRDDSEVFQLDWSCGVAPNTIPAGAQAGRYTVNAILSLVAN